MENPTICADVIAFYGEKVVIIERLESIRGLALPGGKQELGERLSDTAVRELKEETGLDFEMKFVLGTYANSRRDPRGNYVSTVFVGVASGALVAEELKTRVILVTKAEILVRCESFAFDHFTMLMDLFGGENS